MNLIAIPVQIGIDASSAGNMQRWERLEASTKMSKVP